MHPVQAAPRQRSISSGRLDHSKDAPRAGSAEAKKLLCDFDFISLDAPRAGSAEAKNYIIRYARRFVRCTPCRQRRGKARCTPRVHRRQGCTPCRQRRGKDFRPAVRAQHLVMHPVQAAPRQSVSERWLRTGQGEMHPVQAAPRQSLTMQAVTDEDADAPRAGSAEAKIALMACSGAIRDAPRAGSAEAKHLFAHCFRWGIVMHPVQAAPRQRASPVSPARWRPGCTPCRQRRGKDRNAVLLLF